uniref:GRAM domain-containing protein n=1 Tax=Echeneis naucrates TaxID=173247 RepID=A0A665V9X9_ECHNA
MHMKASLSSDCVSILHMLNVCLCVCTCVFQLSKTNCQYHKIFKEISKEEQLRQSYTCALQKDILYQGRMFVSDHWICFHSKVFGKDIKIAIPVVSVTHIKKTKTAILVPNALVVATANDRYMFVSLLSRDNTYKFLMSVCLHLEVGQDTGHIRQTSTTSPKFSFTSKDCLILYKEAVVPYLSHTDTCWFVFRRVHAAAPSRPQQRTASGVRGHHERLASLDV